jgi:hypothetical protein
MDGQAANLKWNTPIIKIINLNLTVFSFAENLYTTSLPYAIRHQTLNLINSWNMLASKQR